MISMQNNENNRVYRKFMPCSGLLFCCISMFSRSWDKRLQVCCGMNGNIEMCLISGFTCIEYLFDVVTLLVIRNLSLTNRSHSVEVVLLCVSDFQCNLPVSSALLYFCYANYVIFN